MILTICHKPYKEILEEDKEYCIDCAQDTVNVYTRSSTGGLNFLTSVTQQILTHHLSMIKILS